jgi:hypothetical protein
MGLRPGPNELRSRYVLALHGELGRARRCLRHPLFSINVVQKRAMLSVRAVFVLRPLQKYGGRPQIATLTNTITKCFHFTSEHMLDIIYACCLQNIVLLSNRTLRSSNSMNASANCALFLRSSASNTLLPELTNYGSAETDDYTHMPTRG